MKLKIRFPGVLLPFGKDKNTIQNNPGPSPYVAKPKSFRPLVDYYYVAAAILLAILLILACSISYGQDQPTTPLKITGKVTDERGKPLQGATVQVKNIPLGMITGKDGTFAIDAVPVNTVLVISFVSFQTQEIPVTEDLKQPLLIRLKANTGVLDEVQVVAYGQTTRRLNTGSVSTINSKQIEQQPVTNVLSALAGRAAGVFVQTTNGLPGGNINIQIRGKGSITAGTNPLYIIDDVPFSPTVGALTSSSLLSTAINGAVSPFNSLNPDDIESITILKDADATAIYGSRGSNGVVLITTKKGKAGKTKTSLDISSGVNRAANLPKLLNFQQYQQISREAYANDGLVPSPDPTDNNYAPQLTTWNKVPPVNWAKYLLGGTGHVSNYQATLSGGSEGTSFTAGANYRSEKTYLPGDNRYQRGGVYTNIQHTSADKKFYFQFSNTLNLDNNHLVNPSAGIVYDILLPPNYPVYDETGNYNWYAGSNPTAELNATAKTSTYNILSNVLLRYRVARDLNIKLSAGYNRIDVSQTQLFPSAALYPGSVNYTNFGKNNNQSFIVEPQLDYVRHFGSASLNLLAGGTYQNSIAQGEVIQASNYSSAALMENLGSASNYITSNSYTQYKYASLFGRATYNLDDKYIINASVRQDASSKFGPGNRTGTFGAVGAAWLWGEEKLVTSSLPWLSFGKLRASYGLTGNDQITDYQYLSTYRSSGYTYQDLSGLKPSRIANADFHWETTTKLEMALELGFLKNRVLFNVNRYQSRSRDQLVAYTIPSITGFTSYQANLPAVVKNTGWEFELTTFNIKNSHFNWSTNFNLTLPRNVLESFQNLASSSYANSLVIGEDINRVYGYQFIGLDNTGQALYRSKNGGATNSPDSETDAYYTIGKRTPDFYGGIGNSFTFYGWSLDILGQFAKQGAIGNLTYIPGAQGFNNYAIVLNRWTPDHQQTKIPKSSTFNDYNYYQSSANYFDASYFRIKNIALGYAFPKHWLQKAGIDQAKLFLQGQNLLTFWHRNNPLLDPESGTFNNTSVNMPPVKTVVIGIQTTF